jgi:hypothetical protein
MRIHADPDPNSGGGHISTGTRKLNRNNLNYGEYQLCLRRATRPTMSLAALVNESPTLQQLVDLGVNLYTWEQKGQLGLATKLDFNTDVAPLVRYRYRYTILAAGSAGASHQAGF